MEERACWRCSEVLRRLYFGRSCPSAERKAGGEPKIPEFCVQLPAQLRAMNNVLSPIGECKLDTERILWIRVSRVLRWN